MATKRASSQQREVVRATTARQLRIGRPPRVVDEPRWQTDTCLRKSELEALLSPSARRRSPAAVRPTIRVSMVALRRPQRVGKTTGALHVVADESSRPTGRRVATPECGDFRPLTALVITSAQRHGFQVVRFTHRPARGFGPLPHVEPISSRSVRAPRGLIGGLVTKGSLPTLWCGLDALCDRECTSRRADSPPCGCGLQTLCVSRNRERVRFLWVGGGQSAAGPVEGFAEASRFAELAAGVAGRGGSSVG
jgi:hypothetical protein